MMQPPTVKRFLADLRSDLNNLLQNHITTNKSDESISLINNSIKNFLKNKKGIRSEVKTSRATWKQLYPTRRKRIMAKIGLNILGLPSTTMRLRWYLGIFPYKIEVSPIYSADLEDDEIINPIVRFVMHHPNCMLNTNLCVYPEKRLEMIHLTFEITPDGDVTHF